MWVALRQHALNGFAKQMGLAKTGNDYTYQFHFLMMLLKLLPRCRNTISIGMLRE
jgi:hypothetical protein